jgi:hypothetical protein
MAWKSRVADKNMILMRETVKSFGDDKVYTAEVWGKFDVTGRINSGIDLYNARDHFDFEQHVPVSNGMILASLIFLV